MKKEEEYGKRDKNENTELNQSTKKKLENQKEDKYGNCTKSYHKMKEPEAQKDKP